MSNDPFFSVIIACFNSSEFVSNAIQSVIDQSYDDWELIIIDDCSSDNTLQICNEFAKWNKKINVISLAENSGPAVARNVAVSKSKGSWVAILDSDDVFEKDKLGEQHRFLSRQENKDVVLVGTGVVVEQFNSKAKQIQGIKIYRNNTTRLKRSLLNFEAFPPHSSVAFSRSCFDKVGGYNPQFELAEDKDLFLRLSTCGDFGVIEKPLIRSLVRGDSLTNRRSKSRNLWIYTYSFMAVVCFKLKPQNEIEFQNTEDFKVGLSVVASALQYSMFRQHSDFLLANRDKTRLKRGLCYVLNPQMLVFRLFKKLMIKVKIDAVVRTLINELKV